MLDIYYIILLISHPQAIQATQVEPQRSATCSKPRSSSSAATKAASRHGRREATGKRPGNAAKMVEKWWKNDGKMMKHGRNAQKMLELL